MFIKTELQQEFHKNGTLAFEQTIAILEPLFATTYEKRLTSPNGYDFIRIGRHVKYFDNGQLAWELNYNEKGEVIKENKPQYQKDGTIIQY